MKGVRSGGDQIPVGYRSKYKVQTERGPRKNSIAKSNTRIFESTDSVELQ